MGGDVKPVRLRLSRRKGFDLQALSQATNGLPAVNCARPTRWGNPHKIGDPVYDGITGRRSGTLTAVQVVQRFRERECPPHRSGEIARLRGHNLACWCALCPEHTSGKPFGIHCCDCSPCHADVLLELANAPAGRATLSGTEGETRHGE